MGAERPKQGSILYRVNAARARPACPETGRRRAGLAFVGKGRRCSLRPAADHWSGHHTQREPMLKLTAFRKPRTHPAKVDALFAVYPDGEECRIEYDRKAGSGQWKYRRRSWAGPGKQAAIDMALKEGARIEERSVANPNFLGPR